MNTIPGKFVWFEVVGGDHGAAQRFYGEVLGWKVQSFPMGKLEYPMITAGGQPIGGFTPGDKGEAPHIVPYVSVTDVAAATKKVKSAGGTVIVKPFDIPTVGRAAHVADAEGAKLYLFRSASPDEDDAAPPKPGTVCWTELWTADARQALSFYRKVLGYTHIDMDMGPMGTYHVLESGGAPRGGVLTVPRTRAEWLTYVAVDDVDATVARARRHAATVEQPAQEIPGIGRWSILRDPQGVRFAVMTPAAQG